tara:strand:- start:259 stop:924 length:666 start_codon:yes stop_codon:yes gene_type:complete
MDSYDPEIVFSSIDIGGRYSYKNQPAILIWNLSKLAQTLIPLIDKKENKAIEKLTEVLQHVMPCYQEYFYKELGKKLGLESLNKKHIILIKDYLKILKSESIDFTLSFRNLSNILGKIMTIEDSVFVNVNDFKKWLKNWNDEISKKINIKDVIKKMDLINPCYIPRNHIIENALHNALNGDMSLIEELMQLYKNPFEEQEKKDLFKKPAETRSQYVTFCGT